MADHYTPSLHPAVVIVVAEDLHAEAWSAAFSFEDSQCQRACSRYLKRCPTADDYEAVALKQVHAPELDLLRTSRQHAKLDPLGSVPPWDCGARANNQSDQSGGRGDKA